MAVMCTNCIWNYNTHKNSNVDEQYLKNIHQTIGGKVSGRVYIIAPANSIGFITDYYEIDGLRYYFLKIPYQVVKELHKIPFHKLRQPQSKNNVNNLDDAIGFHFIKQPEVKTVFKKTKDEIIITIKEFKSQYYKDEEGKVLENFETFSSVFIDKNFNDKQFIMTNSYFADELLSKKKKSTEESEEDDEEIREGLRGLEKDGMTITLKRDDVGEKIMLVYTDIYGNDFTEVFSSK